MIGSIGARTSLMGSKIGLRKSVTNSPKFMADRLELHVRHRADHFADASDAPSVDDESGGEGRERRVAFVELLPLL